MTGRCPELIYAVPPELNTFYPLLSPGPYGQPGFSARGVGKARRARCGFPYGRHCLALRKTTTESRGFEFSAVGKVKGGSRGRRVRVPLNG